MVRWVTTHRMLPLYEAKMIHHYDDRWATYQADGLIRDVTLDEKSVSERLGGRSDRGWLLGGRRVARSTDERTLICTKLEDVGIGDSTNTSCFLFEQIPLPSPEQHWRIDLDPIDWFTQRVLRLAQVEVADELRAEIDAAAFHLYGVNRDDPDYIMDTFPIIKRKDEAAHGEYRTKRLILEAYDRLTG